MRSYNDFSAAALLDQSLSSPVALPTLLLTSAHFCSLSLAVDPYPRLSLCPLWTVGTVFDPTSGVPLCAPPLQYYLRPRLGSERYARQ
jgi:hypothetical protein